MDVRISFTDIFEVLGEAVEAGQCSQSGAEVWVEVKRGAESVERSEGEQEHVFVVCFVLQGVQYVLQCHPQCLPLHQPLLDHSPEQQGSGVQLLVRILFEELVLFQQIAHHAQVDVLHKQAKWR